MPAVPANTFYLFELQDDRGFRAKVRIATFNPDISTSVAVVGDVYGLVSGVGAALQAMTNAKVVKSGWQFDYGYAQEPTTEGGTYELVRQGAHLQGGDGSGGFMAVTIPAPIDSLFEATTQDNLIVVKPGTTPLMNFQAALAATVGTANGVTPRGGFPFKQFFGGQLKSQKPPRRRVLQGA